MLKRIIFRVLTYILLVSTFGCQKPTAVLKIQVQTGNKYSVDSEVITGTDQLSSYFQKNRNKYKNQMKVIVQYAKNASFADINSIFEAATNSGLLALYFAHIESDNNEFVSIDLPSGSTRQTYKINKIKLSIMSNNVFVCKNETMTFDRLKQFIETLKTKYSDKICFELNINNETLVIHLVEFLTYCKQNGYSVYWSDDVDINMSK